MIIKKEDVIVLVKYHIGKLKNKLYKLSVENNILLVQNILKISKRLGENYLRLIKTAETTNDF